MESRPIIIGALAGAMIGSAFLSDMFFIPDSSAGNPNPPVARLWENSVSSSRQAGLPQRLKIGKLEIDAAVEHVGIIPSGAMDVPKQWENVAWFKSGSRPGERGNAVMAGHLDSDTGKAVFWELKRLEPGDIVEVSDGEMPMRFVVRESRRFTDSDAPIGEIFGSGTGFMLNLITCGGAWNESRQRYAERLVVFTELIP